MKQLLGLVALILLLAIGWRISSRLSPDAIGLATGVIFGVVAALPAAVLVMASNRRKQREDDERGAARRSGGAYPYGGYPQQPPVIVLANPAPPQAAPQPDNRFAAGPMQALPPPVDEGRQFRIIGEPGELEEEYN